MIFFVQKQNQHDAERQSMVDELASHFDRLDLPYPGAMVQMVKDHCAEHLPGITVGMIGGTITVSDRIGILLRIRTAG